jgi:nitrate reductase beta subunit
MIPLIDGYTGHQLPSKRIEVRLHGERVGKSWSMDLAGGFAIRHRDKGRQKMRRCMCCQTEFLSQWIGNRLCEKCSREGEGMI